MGSIKVCYSNRIVMEVEGGDWRGTTPLTAKIWFILFLATLAILMVGLWVIFWAF